MPGKIITYVVMRVTLEHEVKDLADKAAAKLRTTQGVDLVEAAEVSELNLMPGAIRAIDLANSFAPRNADGTLAQAPD